MPHAFAGRQVGRLVVVLAASVTVARGLRIPHPRGALRNHAGGGDSEPEGTDQYESEDQPKAP
jgi:hypothetical protein